MPTPSLTNHKPKGQRAGGYHVRSGCITCKIRHVKCDEEKPSCLKCRSTGRTCDGYLQSHRRRSPNSANAATASTVVSLAVQPAQSRSIIFPLIPPPNSAIGSTPQERHCFEYFRLHIGRELTVALMLKPIEQFILQACHSNPAIKSAVLALGSMGRRFRINQTLNKKNAQANDFQAFAQLQYGKALEQLRVQMHLESGCPSVDHVTVSCFLFTIFEFLQGNETASLTHLRSGLDILRREDGLYSRPNSLKWEIARVFAVMDMQAAVWLGPSTVQSSAAMPPDILQHIDQVIIGHPDHVLPSLNHFSSIDAASEALNFQITRMHHFRQWIAAKASCAEDVSPQIHVRRRELMTDLERWPGAVHALLQQMPEITEETDIRIKIMRLNYHQTLLFGTTCLEDCGLHRMYPHREAQFPRMISLAKTILSAHLPHDQLFRLVALNNQETNPCALFSFYAGVAQPLYMVAIHCRSLELSQEAISLLCAEPWREGAWDSHAMGKIAERKVRQLQRERYYLYEVDDLSSDLAIDSMSLEEKRDANFDGSVNTGGVERSRTSTEERIFEHVQYLEKP